MKKFLVMLTAILCLALSGVLLACGDEATYHTLIFEEKDGVTYDSGEIMSGAKVLDGYTVKFGVTLDEDVQGTAVVKANDKVLNVGDDGKYSFKMSADTTVRVTGVEKIQKCNVVFNKGEWRISYESENGDAENGFQVDAGEIVKFKINVSSYYIDKYEVAANTEIITPDANGYYSVYVTDDTTISVYGLEQEAGFIDREDGGSGTQEDPYKISRPIDLYYMSVLINNEFWAGTGYYRAYYELTNDIDMEGEQMFVIGDMTSQTAFFGGNFNGNGYTISNFYVKDSIVEQEAFSEVFLQYIGMFGYAAATTTSAPQIYNLNLSDFTMHVDAQRVNSTFAAGGIVGVGIGANISGCSVKNATITADADYAYFGYIGGIIGVHQSAYQDETMRFYAYLNGCSADVDISVDTGYAYAVGGIAGYQMSYEEQATAFILNSYSAGTIAGGINTGGIVGRSDANTSISGCYSTATVLARSLIGVTGMEDADVYAHAYAGGIVGYLDYNSVLSDSFATSEVYASSSTGEKQYEHAGELYGAVNADGTPTPDAKSAIVINSYGRTDKDSFTNDFFKNTLLWSEADWLFNESGYPTTNKGEESKTFTISISYEQEVDGKTASSHTITNQYIPMSYWYLITDEFGKGLVPQYLTADNGMRSYGYYFSGTDYKVPYGYVPTRDVNLTVKFASYDDVVGKYFVKPASNNTVSTGNSVYIELLSDGTCRFVSGARVRESSYYYDGEKVYIEWTALARLGVFADDATRQDAENYYYTFAGKVENGVLSVYDGTYFTVDSAIVAVAENEFATGKYYADSVDYIFYANGTGKFGNEDITYVVSANAITVTRLNTATTITGEVENGLLVTLDGKAVTKYDAFEGVWESAIANNIIYTFDGKGGWEYKLYGHANGSNALKDIQVVSGTYTVYDNGIMLMKNGATNFARAYFNDNGYLLVEGVDVDCVCYRQGSLVGTWTFDHVLRDIELNLKGINANNEGIATVTYSNGISYDATYEVVRAGSANGYKVTVYNGDFMFAQLSYSLAKDTLEGQLFDVVSATYYQNAVLCVPDMLYGEWVSNVEELETLNFNGYGAYDLNGSADTMAVYGEVIINGTDFVEYTYSNEDFTAKFTYDGKEYVVAVDGDALVITYEETDYDFVRYDGWKNVVLFSDDADMTLTFDGLGKLEQGGTITVTTTSTGNVRKFYYNDTGNANMITVKNPETTDVYGITKADDEYTLVNVSRNEKISLYLKNDFTGNWIVRRSGAKLEIGNFGGADKAQGTFNGKETTYNIDKENNLVTFTVDGVDYEITMLTGNELSLSTDSITYVCMPEAKADEYKGTWTSENSSYTFDGLGNSTYGGGIVTERDKNGNLLGYYTYVINEYGVAEILKGRVYYLFYVDDEGEFVNGTATASIIESDLLYLVTATDSASDARKFEFDGKGNVDVYISNALTGSMTYEIVSHDETAKKITITLSDGTNEQTAVIDYSFTVDSGKIIIIFE